MPAYGQHSGETEVVLMTGQIHTTEAPAGGPGARSRPPAGGRAYAVSCWVLSMTLRIVAKPCRSSRPRW